MTAEKGERCKCWLGLGPVVAGQDCCCLELHPSPLWAVLWGLFLLATGWSAPRAFFHWLVLPWLAGLSPGPVNRQAINDRA